MYARLERPFIKLLENLGIVMHDYGMYTGENTEEEINAIVKYAVGHATLKGCPVINEESLLKKGLL